MNVSINQIELETFRVDWLLFVLWSISYTCRPRAGILLFYKPNLIFLVNLVFILLNITYIKTWDFFHHFCWLVFVFWRPHSVGSGAISGTVFKSDLWHCSEDLLWNQKFQPWLTTCNTRASTPVLSLLPSSKHFNSIDMRSKERSISVSTNAKVQIYCLLLFFLCMPLLNLHIIIQANKFW